MHSPGKQLRRKVEERFFLAAMVLSLLLVVGALLSIVGVIAIRGLPSLNLEMLTRTPQGGFYLGKEGGILNAIAGSCILAFSATALALLVALPATLYINLYAPRRSRFSETVRFAMDVMWGIPSIVYGAFGFVLMALMGFKASLGAAILTVAVFELPILLRAMDEVLRCVPAELVEASYSLGATRFETATRILLRQTLPGLLTALLIAFGRGIGDTASVLFTAGFTDRMPGGLADPAATLPLAIFFQLGTPFPEVQGRAYASAAVLTIIVLAVSLLSRLLGKRFSRNALK